MELIFWVLLLPLSLSAVATDGLVDLRDWLIVLLGWLALVRPPELAGLVLLVIVRSTDLFGFIFWTGWDELATMELV